MCVGKIIPASVRHDQERSTKARHNELSTKSCNGNLLAIMFDLHMVFHSTTGSYSRIIRLPRSGGSTPVRGMSNEMAGTSTALDPPCLLL